MSVSEPSSDYDPVLAGEVGTTAARVWQFLQDNSNYDPRYKRMNTPPIAIQTIADALGVCERTIQRAMKVLRAKGLFFTHYHYADGHELPNNYSWAAVPAVVPVMASVSPLFFFSSLLPIIVNNLYPNTENTDKETSGDIEKPRRTTESYREEVKQALFQGIRDHQGKPDFGDFPEQWLPWAEAFVKYSGVKYHRSQKRRWLKEFDLIANGYGFGLSLFIQGIKASAERRLWVQSPGSVLAACIHLDAQKRIEYGSTYRPTREA